MAVPLDENALLLEGWALREPLVPHAVVRTKSKHNSPPTKNLPWCPRDNEVSTLPATPWRPRATCQTYLVQHLNASSTCILSFPAVIGAQPQRHQSWAETQVATSPNAIVSICSSEFLSFSAASWQCLGKRERTPKSSKAPRPEPTSSRSSAVSSNNAHNSSRTLTLMSRKREDVLLGNPFLCGAKARHHC